MEEITDDSFAQQEVQCPKCLQLTKHQETHKCRIQSHWWKGSYCTICAITLEKKEKMVGRYMTLGRTKKNFRIVNSYICYNCACKVTRELNDYNRTDKNSD